MALNVKINTDDRYKIETVNSDLSAFKFSTVLKDGTTVPLAIQISEKSHSLMPNVYNLAFGPLNENGEIDDAVKLHHQDHSKVFSTIVFAASSFLTENPDLYLGIDGSCNARAYMYYRCIQNNYTMLEKLFRIYGVKYYARVLRIVEDEYPIDCDDFIAVPEIIDRAQQIKCDKLYNYFIFNNKINII